MHVTLFTVGIYILVFSILTNQVIIPHDQLTGEEGRKDLSGWLKWRSACGSDIAIKKEEAHDDNLRVKIQIVIKSFLKFL